MKKGKKSTLLISFISTLCVGIGLLSGAAYLTNQKKEVPQISPTTINTWLSTLGDFEAKSQVSSNCLYDANLEMYYYAKDHTKKDANNIFGLYVYADNKKFIELAEELVNSKGGSWGYVLIPYNVKDYDFKKWKEVFKVLNDEQLIPIIQLYDVDLDDYKQQTKAAAKFLNKLLWPIKQRYISVYNEPNDDKFWFNNSNPAQYAKILDYTIDQFKEEHPNFFMLNGALNSSALSSDTYLDFIYFMREMNDAYPGIFTKLDGWASHSYPQPNFSGSPYTVGRNGIRAYAEELKVLKTLGVTKDLPVFITETGWAHAEGESYNSVFFTSAQIAEFFKIAYTEIWGKDPRVRAVTPFTIWYEPPFDHFSWITKDKIPYKHFDVVKSLDKVSGNPERLLTQVKRVTTCTYD